MSDRGLPKGMVVEDDPGRRTQLKWALSRYDVCLAEDRPNALALLEKENPSIVILDLGLPPDRDGASEGLAALKTILSLSPETKVIVASGNDDRKNALEAISGGAYDFYSKPLDQAVLEVIINRAWNCY